MVAFGYFLATFPGGTIEPDWLNTIGCKASVLFRRVFLALESSKNVLGQFGYALMYSRAIGFAAGLLKRHSNPKSLYVFADSALPGVNRST